MLGGRGCDNSPLKAKMVVCANGGRVDGMSQKDYHEISLPHSDWSLT